MVAVRSEEYIDPAKIAEWYVMAEENSRALDWLEQGFLEHAGDMVYLSTDPVFDPVRGDPRFQDILRRMNLPMNPEGN